LDDFRKNLRNKEEDIISSIGGVAGWIAALCPTAQCVNTTNIICPWDWVSFIHQLCAIALFGTTIYFCLIAFSRRAQDKIDEAKNKLKIEKRENCIKKANDVITYANRRMLCYGSLGLAIIIIMAALIVVTSNHWLTSIKNLTFWVETVALVLFGFAWLVASHYIGGVVEPGERRITLIERIITRNFDNK